MKRTKASSQSGVPVSVQHIRKFLILVCSSLLDSLSEHVCQSPVKTVPLGHPFVDDRMFVLVFFIPIN